MSEQGWHDFLIAEGVDDWVVLHGGATAVFRLPSLREAARIAEAVAEIPGIESVRVMLNISDGTLTVRLSRDLWHLEPLHTELAIAAKRDAIDVGFWRAVLSYLPMAEDNAIDPLGTGRRSGRRNSMTPSYCAMRCTSTARSHATKPRCGSKQRSLQAVALWKTPIPHLTGRSPIGQAIASASPRRRTHWDHRKATLRGFRERSVRRILELPSRTSQPELSISDT